MDCEECQRIISIFSKIVYEQDDLLEEYHKQLIEQKAKMERQGEENAEMLREIIALKERSFFPYGPIYQTESK